MKIRNHLTRILLTLVLVSSLCSYTVAPTLSSFAADEDAQQTVQQEATTQEDGTQEDGTQDDTTIKSAQDSSTPSNVTENASEETADETADEAADEKSDQDDSANADANKDVVTTTAAADTEEKTEKADENKETTKEIKVSIMPSVNGRGTPITGVEYALYQKVGTKWEKIDLSIEKDFYQYAMVTIDTVKGTTFKWVETKHPTYLHSPLTVDAKEEKWQGKDHVFTLKVVNGEVVSIPADKSFEYGGIPTDNTADSTIANYYSTTPGSTTPGSTTPYILNDYSIDNMDGIEYEWWKKSNTAQFYVLYGTYSWKIREEAKRDYTLELTVKKEVVNGTDPDREFEFTIMPLFGYAIDAKTRFNIAVPGEHWTDDGRLPDSKVISVWLNQPDGDKLVDEEWLAVYLKYIFQLTVPAHTGETWKEKVFESTFSQIEKMNLADSGLIFLIDKDADTSVQTLERVVEIINKNTNYFFEWEGNHFLTSWKKLSDILEKKGYKSFEDWMQRYEEEANKAWKEYSNNKELSEEEAYKIVTEMSNAWLKAMQDAGFTRNDMRFLRVFSQDGLISYTETKNEKGNYNYALEAMSQEQRQQFIDAHKDILPEEIRQYLIGNTFKLKDGESITLTIPHKVALDELGGLLIMEKSSDDYKSSGSISTYMLVAPPEIGDGDTWKVTQVITNTFDKVEEPVVENETKTPTIGGNTDNEVHEAFVPAPEVKEDEPTVKSEYEDDTIKATTTKTTTTRVKGVNTGDGNALYIWGMVLMISICAFVIQTIYRRRSTDR